MRHVTNLKKQKKDWFRNFGQLITSHDSNQAPHIDFSYEYHELAKYSWIINLPFSNEGRWIYFWDDKGTQRNKYHIPLGLFLLRRSDVYHSGHCEESGNYRLHLCLTHLPEKIS